MVVKTEVIINSLVALLFRAQDFLMRHISGASTLRHCGTGFDQQGAPDAERPEPRASIALQTQQPATCTGETFPIVSKLTTSVLVVAMVLVVVAVMVALAMSSSIAKVRIQVLARRPTT